MTTETLPAATYARLLALVGAVRTMRRLQLEYFKTRGFDVLREAQGAERGVDRLLADLGASPPELESQQSLFHATPPPPSSRKGGSK